MRITTLCVLFFIARAVSGAEYSLGIGAGGMAGYCGESVESTFSPRYVPTYVTGSMGELELRVTPRARTFEEIPYNGAHRRWPTGLIIEVGRWDTVTTTCQMDSVLRDQLHFQPYNTWLELVRDSVWRATGREPEGQDRIVQFRCTFVLPEELAGQRLCFSARWVNPEWGNLESVPIGFGYNYLQGDNLTPRPLVVSVIAPCSEADRQQARESHVFEAWIAADWRRTLDLADSLLARGWGSFRVLMYAEGAAKGLGQYGRAIQLLDSLYVQYGGVGAVGDSVSQAREYERMRKDLIELRDQEQQPQR
jgi:hypothetical protein